jgi:hypothetical protein
LNKIQIDHEYHCVELGYINLAVVEWLTEKFGPVGDRWFHFLNKIYFKNEKDYFWFELNT